MFKETLQVNGDVLNGQIIREILTTGQRIVSECNDLFRSRLGQEVVFHSTEEELDDDFVREWRKSFLISPSNLIKN
jgi:hypothetical protein